MRRITYYEALFAAVHDADPGVRDMHDRDLRSLNYFTYYEDFKMYRDVASSFIFLFTLPVMVFASTKVIDEEIENRTMLTLMSKPVSRTQVVLGKSLGVVTLVLVSVTVLSVMAAMCSYLRWYDDNLLDYRIVITEETKGAITALELNNFKAFMALLPAAVLTFLQVATLGAVSVAISTRFGLAVNVTAVVLIYMSASLAPYFRGAPRSCRWWCGAGSSFCVFAAGAERIGFEQRLVFGEYRVGTDSTFGAADVCIRYGNMWGWRGCITCFISGRRWRSGWDCSGRGS